jgi:hypothetical protein
MAVAKKVRCCFASKFHRILEIQIAILSLCGNTGEISTLLLACVCPHVGQERSCNRCEEALLKRLKCEVSGCGCNATVFLRSSNASVIVVLDFFC